MVQPPKPAEPSDTAEGGQPLKPKPLEKKEDKYEWGSTKVEAAEEAPPEETFSITIELKDDNDKEVSAMPNGGSVKFSITVGDETKTGDLDDKGKATINGLPKKPCEVSFPEIHGEEWKKK